MPIASLPFKVVEWRFGPQDARYILPQAMRSKGPLVIGQVTTGSVEELFGGDWLLVLELVTVTVLHPWGGGYDQTVRKLRLYQADGVYWTLRQDLTALLPNNVNVNSIRRVALAFDTAAQPVIAFETGGLIYVSQHQNDNINWRGPFSGYDPLLFNDMQIHENLNEADVHLYLLNSSRSMVLMRRQADQYGQAYIVMDVLTGQVPFYLIRVTKRADRLVLAYAQDDTEIAGEITVEFDPPPLKDSMEAIGTIDEALRYLLILPFEDSNHLTANGGTDAGVDYAAIVPVLDQDSLVTSAGMDEGLNFILTIQALDENTLSGITGSIDAGQFYQTHFTSLGDDVLSTSGGTDEASRN